MGFRSDRSLSGSPDLDRLAVERVLQRATELSAAETDAATAESHLPGQVSPEAVVQAGAEVGIPVRALRKSIALERVGSVEDEESVADRIVGPDEIVQERFVEITPRELLESLDAWLTSVHHLRRIGPLPAEPDAGVSVRVEWIRRDDVAAKVSRRALGLRGDGRLGEVPSVVATVATVDDDTTALRLTLDRHSKRTASMIVTGTASVVAVGCGVAGAVTLAPVAVAALPAGAVAVFSARSGRRHAARLERETARLVGDIEQRATPPKLLSRRSRRA